MDLVTCDDPKACRGIRILEGAVEDHSKLNALLNEEEDATSKVEEPKEKKKEESSKRKGKRKSSPVGQSGLELGRRLLIVLKTNTGQQGSKDSLARRGSKDTKSTSSVMRVVDHGVSQREAVRRLFDAQVLLRSYEEQLQDKEAEVEKLFYSLQEAKKGLQAAAKVDADTNPVNAEAEAVKDPAAEAAARGEKLVVPYWLRSDQTSRENIDRVKNDVVGQVQLKGERIEAAEIADFLWEVGFVFASRWAGCPDDDLVKKNEALDKKFRDIQRQSMQESSMLRQHIKRVEHKYKELANNSKQMKSAMQSTQTALQQAKMQVEQLKRGLSVNAVQAGAVQASYVQAGAVQASAVQASAMQAGAVQAGAVQAGAVQAGAVQVGGVQVGGGGDEGGYPSINTAAMNFDLDQALPAGPSWEDTENARGQGPLSLADDDTMRYGAPAEDLQQMDHEIFEPLCSFDDDMKEMLIDCVNEKVRRILSLDPANFQNGKLPFGLRPDSKSNIEEELEEEIRRLNAKVQDLQGERDSAVKEAEELRRQIEVMRQRQGLKPEPVPQPVIVKQPEPEKPKPVVQGRGPPPPPEKKPEEPAPQPMVVQGYTEKELQAKIAEACKELKQQIALLESKMKQKEKEVEELRAKLMEAMKPKKEKKKEEPPPQIEDKTDEVNALAAKLREMEAALKKSEDDRLDSARRVKELEESLEAERNKPPVEVQAKAPPPVKAAPPPEPDATTSKASQSALHKVLCKVSKELKLEASDAGQKAAEGMLGTDPDVAPFMKIKKGESKGQAEVRFTDKAIGALEAWTEDVMTGLTGLAKKMHELANKPPQIIEKEVIVKETVHVKSNKVESPREGKCYKPQHADLEKKNKELQEEIARLLLTIDEMRRRIEQLQAIPMDPEDEETVKSVMEKVGLKEMAEATSAGHVQLKGVFERLYQDAVQRIQRYGMVRERMFLATKAYSSVTEALEAGQTQGGPDATPDFERLHETTQATLRGMWYNVDSMFKRACEYAMTQGVEASLVGTQKHKELIEGFDYEAYEVSRDRALGSPPKRRGDRLPGRRSERPKEKGAPPKLKDLAGSQANFTSYVAQLREAERGPQAPFAPDKWASQSDRMLDPKSAASIDNEYRTMKAACFTPGSSVSFTQPSLTPTRSLPTLPKMRSQASDVVDISGQMPRSPSQVAQAVDSRNV